eukprot:CAMPEP_0175045326 /NCGR_PEP_ID=MMETSP0052_2-20121109/4348_1 /TAXON_ID=51329 ORGANISM="Polytomella parva, Strain SAG 63-3" /NCGR_SAMPLE_ID=MMETSP0052_2 /ASSEMBLY_ACC=CAM_ASM_000194 /LENGTH=104 /DNA_ID=CAMNT_0016308819 /DNA_START=557 /DNA_END=867 /DNA_ORIENTATION=+
MVVIVIRASERITQASYLALNGKNPQEYSTIDPDYLRLLGVYGLGSSSLPCLRALVSGQVLMICLNLLTIILMGFAGTYHIRSSSDPGSPNESHDHDHNHDYGG